MTREVNRELKDTLADWNVPSPDGWENRLDRFYDLLVEANSKHNLTRITERDDFLFKHVADSLLVARVFPEISQRRRLIDIGCGAGFPGIPLALSFPELDITEVDSVGKKTQCVSEFIRALGIEGRAVHGRARELARHEAYLGQFDLVTARAVADTPRLIKECHRFLADDGVFIAYKTPTQIEEELALTEREAKKAKLRFDVSEVYALPRDLGDRQFLRFERKTPTPS